MRILVRRYERFLRKKNLRATGGPIAVEKRLVRNLKSRGLFPDADKNYGNRARTRRRQWAVASRACW